MGIPKHLLHSTPMDPLYREAYNRDLARSMGSKLFFLGHIPVAEVSQFVDLGCADGALLHALHAVVPEAEFIGIDNDPEQLHHASLRFPEATYKQFGFGDRPAVGKSVLVMSSLLHEVWSQPGFEWSSFMAAVEREGFDYICIRDFGLPQWSYTKDTPEEWLDAILGTRHHLDLLADFEARHGSIGFMSNCLHFLLKSPYRANWAREMDEDYTRCSRETTLWQCLMSGAYRVPYAEGTVTPNFRRRLVEEFGIALPCTTHLEVVLQRVK